MGKLHNKGYGFMKQYVMGIITSGSTSDIGISDSDRNTPQYFNIAYVTNNSAEDIEIILDGNTERKIVCLNGTAVEVTGSRFRDIQIKNLDGANDTSADEIKITIQKEFSRLEEVELLGVV